MSYDWVTVKSGGIRGNVISIKMADKVGRCKKGDGATVTPPAAKNGESGRLGEVS